MAPLAATPAPWSGSSRRGRAGMRSRVPRAMGCARTLAPTTIPAHQAALDRRPTELSELLHARVFRAYKRPSPDEGRWSPEMHISARAIRRTGAARSRDAERHVQPTRRRAAGLGGTSFCDPRRAVRRISCGAALERCAPGVRTKGPVVKNVLWWRNADRAAPPVPAKPGASQDESVPRSACGGRRRPRRRCVSLATHA